MQGRGFPLRRRRPDDLPDPREIAERVAEIDRILEERFLSEVAPALERARSARPRPA